MPIKVPEYESRVTLPTGQPHFGSPQLPDYGLGKIGKEMAESGETLVKVAAQGMHLEMESKLTELAVQAHQSLYKWSQDTREESPQNILARMPQEFGAIKEAMLKDLPANLQGVFSPQYDRIALVYQKSIASQAQHRLDRASMAAELKNFADMERTIAENGDPFAKFMLTSNLQHAIDMAGTKHYWDPVQLQPYRAKVEQLFKENKIYADVFSSPDGPDKTIGRLLQDPAYYGVNPDDAPTAVAKIRQMVQQREDQAREGLIREYGPNIPAPAIDLLVKQGMMRPSVGLHMTKEANISTVTAAVIQDPVRFRREMEENPKYLGQLLNNDPEAIAKIQSFAYSKDQQYRHANTRPILQMMATDDPKLPEALTAVVKNIEYYDEAAVRMAKNYLKHQHDHFPGDPVLKAELLNKLAGSNTGANGQPLVTVDELGRYYGEKRLNWEDTKMFTGMVVKRLDEQEKPQFKAMDKVIGDINRAWAANGLVFFDEGAADTNSRLYPYYTQHVNRAREAMEKFRSENRTATYNQVVQVGQEYVLEAASKAFQANADMIRQKDVQSSFWKTLTASPTERKRAFAAQPPSEQVPRREQPGFKPGVPLAPPKQGVKMEYGQ